MVKTLACEHRVAALAEVAAALRTMFGTNIDVIDDRNATHPATGERLDFNFMFGSTSVDFRVTILSCEGLALGNIYGYDESSRQINSSYPYDELMLILAKAGIDPVV